MGILYWCSHNRETKKQRKKEKFIYASSSEGQLSQSGQTARATISHTCAHPCRTACIGLSQNSVDGSVVDGNEGTCHPVQQCGSLIGFYGTEEDDMYGSDTHKILVSDSSGVCGYMDGNVCPQLQSSLTYFNRHLAPTFTFPQGDLL